MPLPHLLQQFIDNEISKINISKLNKAYSDLTNLYRINRNNIELSLTSNEQRISYISARMPSTYESVFKVLKEISDYCQEEITSILDIGAGPGTASWAACEIFSSIKNVTLIEQNSYMTDLGKKLSTNHSVLKNAQWITDNITKQNLQMISEADFVIASYSFNEINNKDEINILNYLWSKTNKFLIIIDPGSKDSFNKLHEARKWSIENKINIFSPCPHTQTCPAFANNDWCHFYTRVQRTSIHKKLKNAERGYEDEKFSYLVLSKKVYPIYDARILRHPEIHSGHLKLNICTKNGIEIKTYSKKNGKIYKLARKADWGNRWNLSNPG